MRKIVLFCFIFPLIFSLLNIQGFITLFVSNSIAQTFAYFNLVLLIIGIILEIKNTNNFSVSAKLWIIFYVLYYSFGLISTVFSGFDAPIARTIVPVTYFISFFIFLGNEHNKKIFSKVTTILLVIACLMLIFLFFINFDFDNEGIHIYKLDRASGIYGDANNSALVCILAYLFLSEFFKTSNYSMKILKIILLSIIIYSLFLTFSTTGLTSFIIIFFIYNWKYFSKERIILLFSALVTILGFILYPKYLITYFKLSDAQQLKIENLQNVVLLNSDKIDNSGRDELLENLFKYIEKSPLIGNGIDFSVSIRGHNTYIGVWADAGIFVFLFFCIILFTYIHRAFILQTNKKYFCLSILCTLYIFMASLQTVINQGYLLTILCYVLFLIDNKESKYNFA